MTASALSQVNAFNPGADLWIVADLEKSPWTAKIDWYLNFQICKASRHTARQPSDFVIDVIQKTELTTTKLTNSSSLPLMIASQLLLPNKWVVILPWNGDLKTWSEKAFDIWQKLQQPSLRVFLPPGQSASFFQAPWKDQTTPIDFTIVLD